ncbi:hypothetical protein CAPTEDRAFT_106482 [Capitella teleta]|uniref:ABC transporter domain-containing protein n=1 Tax=Capitella teleta TaxID=283909 RepID=R7UIK2_CAPTE|nr:hypothetical protein CAPTEDRAFT_106482 [Capitella teleta]|eukprot:ELU05928.1 hypothetical protein CAPTEDRAFT_106482 [Capitella teleta]
MDKQAPRSLERATSTVQGATLSLHNVSYAVQAKVSGKLFATYPKEILNDINGIFRPGMNAILGPTGSGKSSLLDLIAGRKDPRGVKGTLLVDGLPQPKNFKCMTGYVVQDDIVTGTLTVRENLMFSANLRISDSVPTKVRKEKVEETIKELGLQKCADSKIGTEFIRGVSGGERKRTNIGMELVISPPVLFLDEPTTGLDASTSNSVMRLLQNLSRRGRTIIFSIHQPRFSIFKTFDHMMLLCEGKTVYHGPAQQALSYYEDLGFECEEFNNPPDFFLDVILGDIPPNTENKKKQGIKAHEARENLAKYLSEEYEKSSLYAQLRNDIDPIYDEYEKQLANGSAKQIMVGEYANGFLSQTATVSSRALKNLVRDPQTVLMQMFLAIFMGIIAGIVYWQLEDSYESGIQNRTGAIFFIAMNMVFSSVSAIVTFISERALFIHERVSGFYRVSCYFLSKMLFDIVPLRLLPTTVFICITYFMIGFQLDVENFFMFYLTIVLLTFTAACIAFFASTVTREFLIAQLVCILIVIISMIFGGFFVNLDTMGDWLSWLQYVSIFRYGLNALMIVELKDQSYCTNITVPVFQEVCALDCSQYGNDYLRNNGIGFETSWDFWQNEVALCGLLTFFLVIAFILLQNINKYK